MVERITEALHCVNHALMVLPLPSDGSGKRAWSSLLEARKLLEAAALSTEPGEAEGTAPQDRLSRDQDIVLEALNEYDAWMMDDDYDAIAVLHRIMARMRSRILPAAPTSEGSHHG